MNRGGGIRVFIRFIGLLLLQGLILSKLDLFGFINPMAYVAFVFLHPFKKNLTFFLIPCFLLGLGIDFFSDSGGIHASSLLLIAAVRVHALSFFSGKHDIEHQTISIYDIPPAGRLYFMFALTILHHFAFFSLTYFSVGSILDILYDTMVTSAATIVIIYLGLTIFNGRRK
jgi:hypothetical protein